MPIAGFSLSLKVSSAEVQSPVKLYPPSIVFIALAFIVLSSACKFKVKLNHPCGSDEL